MSRPRIIPVLLLKHGLLVRSQSFRVHQVIGNPVSTIERFSHWNVDELVLLDIGDSDRHDLRRDDLEVRLDGSSVIDVLRAVAPASAMPLTVGGRIRSIDDIERRLAAGADKVVITTAAHDDPELITRAADRFGAQCVVVGVDVASAPDGDAEVRVAGGRVGTGRRPWDWAAEAEARGAGEIFLSSIDRDGAACGYDLGLIARVCEATSVPVIACGGAGSSEDFPEAITTGGASAAAAANIFHFLELSYPHAKRACERAGVDVRPPRLGSRWFAREPEYDTADRDRRLRERQARSLTPAPAESRPHGGATRFCTRCVYPAISAVPLEFDDDGVCTGCRVAEARAAIPDAEWARRRELLIETLDRARSRDGSRHDCVIPVSGGKDSWFQTHVVVNELGFNPLLVTYNGNNWTPAGWRNVHRMKEVFGVDHVMVSPSVATLRTLNRLGMRVMGDMNWHAHVGITSAPVAVAAQHGIPLVLWGEHGYLDLGGQFSLDDFPEMTYRDRFEHFARGYEWNYFVGLEGLRPRDLIPWRYPSDERLLQLGLRGVYLGNYLPWEANDHGAMVIEEYGFEVASEGFERTYRRMSNLDDMHENGVHDYMKYIKFGYGRCTDHACKDIRAGLMSREEAVELVREHDHRRPSDLERWLSYSGMPEAEFDRLADTFRDPRAWWRRDGRWVREAVWGEAVEEPATAEHAV